LKRRELLDAALRGAGIRPDFEDRRPERSTPGELPALEIPEGAVIRAACVGLAVFLAGFGMLLGFWLGGDPRPGVPGFFDYAAATLGDGLLLPLLAFVCFLGLAFVPGPARGERGWTLAGVFVGLAVSAIIQVAWLRDPDPNLNWTLVAPHELNTAGWWHLAFFVLAGGFFGGCAARLALRVRNADAVRRQQLVECGWLETVAFCAFGFLLIAAGDNLAAADTQAGLATAAGVCSVAALFVAGLALAFRFVVREIVSPIALALGGATGLTLLAAYGLPVPAGAAIVGIVISGSLGAGLSATAFAGAAAAPPGKRAPLMAAAVVQALLAALTLAGSLSLGVHLVGAHGLVAALAVLVGSFLAVATARDSEQGPGHLVLRITAVAYAVGLIVLTGWVSEDRTSAEANYAVGFAAFFLDGLVLGMIREQFAAVIRSDVLGRDERGRETEEVGLDTMIRVLTFGVAALAALGALFAAAAPTLGLDVVDSFPEVDYGLLVAALVGALTLTSAARLQARRADPLKKRREPPELDPKPHISGDTVSVNPVAAGLALLGLGLWSGVVLWSSVDAGLEMVPVAAVGACLIGLMAFEDIVRTCTRLQLHSPDLLTWVMAAAVGTTVAVGIFFTLSAGLWDDALPASGAASMVALLVPAATIVVVSLAAAPIAFGLHEDKVTPQSPSQNVLLVESLYGGLALIALILPMMAVARVGAIDPANVGLVAVTCLAALPPLLGAFFWVQGNNSLHLELQLRRIEKGENLPPPLRRIRSSGSRSPAGDWTAWMRTHNRFQNRVSLAVVVAGFAWMAAELLL
jgi:hypothetical protein